MPAFVKVIVGNINQQKGIDVCALHVPVEQVFGFYWYHVEKWNLKGIYSEHIG